MADLGDISNFLKDSSATDLSWLDVDETEYRKLDQLPKQNLDIVPDLQALWSHEDKPSTAYFDKDLPHTIGDMSQVHGPLRAKPEDIVRSLRFAMMQTTDMTRIKATLVRRYDQASLRNASVEISEASSERGLLGRLYIQASDFPGCTSTAAEFVRRHASEARYVVAKVDCAGCVYALQGPTGCNCSVFHKEVTVAVPYTDKLASDIEALQIAKGKNVQASEGNPKTRIRLALLASDVPVVRIEASKPVLDASRMLSPVTEIQPIQVTPDLTNLRNAARKAITEALETARITVVEAQQGFRLAASYQSGEGLKRLCLAAEEATAPGAIVYSGVGEQPEHEYVPRKVVEASLEAAEKDQSDKNAQMRQASLQKKACPVISLLRREMLKGRGESELVQALKLAFDVRDLQETKSLWEPIFKQAGLFGVVYIPQGAFDDCHEGSDFLARHSSAVKAIVAGQKCSGCIYSKIGRCLLYGRPLVKEASDVLTPEVVQSVIREHVAASRLDPITARFDFEGDPTTVLKKVHRVVDAQKGKVSQAPERLSVQTAFHGIQAKNVTSALTKRDIIKATQRYMNEGLYGDQLLEVLKGRFDRRDLVAAQKELKTVLAEQGLQGIFYVDPSVYEDYGHGCNEAMRLHRSRLVSSIKLGPKCSSCVLQTKPGYCSKLDKQLVIEPLYADKQAQQREILASGKATEIDYSSLVNNGHNMVAEYEMQQRGMNVEVDPVPMHDPMSVILGMGAIKL